MRKNIFILSKFPLAKILKNWRIDLLKGLLAGLATVASYGLICVVLQFEQLSAVVSLRQISVLIVIYWGCWKLKEPFGRQRLFAGLLILIGVILISFGNPEK